MTVDITYYCMFYPAMHDREDLIGWIETEEGDEDDHITSDAVSLLNP